MIRNFGLMAALLFFLPAGFIHAQDSTLLWKKTEARQLFAGREYGKALPLFRELVARYPKEPEYLYSTGVCLVKQNETPAEAIALLRQANNTGYNPLSWYYLGLALHRSYQFEDAIRAYSRFILLGKESDVKTLEVDRLVEMAKNGTEYTKTGRKLEVTGITRVPADKLETATDINGSGKLVRKPVEFCSKTDLREGFRPLMFLPTYTEINDFVYVAGYEKKKKNQKQLYRVRNINHETWGVPEALPLDINTPYDEEYPFFDSKNAVLYFSSKGHSSMGGYDIFKTTYDWNTKTWSKPENLGFPINTPYDDFFYVTDGFGQDATFLSNRNTGPGQASLYKIRIRQDTLISLHTADDMVHMSLPEVQTPRQPEIAALPKSVSDTPEIVVTDSLLKPVNDTYARMISEALSLQLRSDSLSRLAREKRLQAKESPDGEGKRQMIADILRVEKESKRLQREADQKYALADQMKGRIPQTMADTAVIPAVAEPTVDLPGPEKPQPEAAPAPRADIFDITVSSPYNAANPIPSSLSREPGLVYRIQLGAFSKPRPNDAFGGIQPIAREEITPSQVHKYYAGLFYRIASVNQALQRVRSAGFPDAFVVAFLDGSLITTEKAREVEFGSMKY
jgi:hypothetical protein